MIRVRVHVSTAHSQIARRRRAPHQAASHSRSFTGVLNAAAVCKWALPALFQWNFWHWRQ